LTFTRPIAFIDIESTGTDPSKDRIIELALIVLKPDGTRTKWSSRFNPGRPIPPESTDIHRITDSDVADAPLFHDRAAELHRELHGKDLAGYNLRRFDLLILDEEFRRCALKLNVEDVLIIDCLGIFSKKAPRKLEDAVRRYCGREHTGAHGAAEDADATADVFLGQLQAHEDLQAMDLAAIADFSVFGDNKLADLAGKLYFDAGGDLRFSFGKHRSERVKDNPEYVGWMYGADFPGSTLDFLKNTEVEMVSHHQMSSSPNPALNSLPGARETAPDAAACLGAAVDAEVECEARARTWNSFSAPEQTPGSQYGQGTIPDEGCEVCKRQQVSYIEIELPDNSGDSEHVNFCGWLCLIQFASLRASRHQNSLRVQIEELEAKNQRMADDSYELDFYRAGCLS